MIVTPGNYGADYLREHMNLPFEKNIKCSNYVGETIDMANELGFEQVFYFFEFFRRASGLTPMEFRKRSGKL